LPLGFHLADGLFERFYALKKAALDYTDLCADDVGELLAAARDVLLRPLVPRVWRGCARRRGCSSGGGRGWGGNDGNDGNDSLLSSTRATVHTKTPTCQHRR